MISACYHRQTPSEGSGAESLLAASSFWRLLAIPGTPCLCQRDSSLPSLDTTFFPVCLLCLLLTETPVIQFRIHPVPRWALQVLCIHASPGYGQVLVQKWGLPGELTLNNILWVLYYRCLCPHSELRPTFVFPVNTPTSLGRASPCSYESTAFC